MRGSVLAHSDRLPSFVDGGRIEIGDAAKSCVRPWDGVSFGTLLEAGQAGVAQATASSAAAFKSYGTAPLHQRIELLTKAAAALEGAVDEIASLISDDIGKPIRIARIEVKRGVEFVRGCAAVVATLSGETVPVDAAAAGAGGLGFVRRIPYGVVAAITPFNAPVNLLLQKVAPAIAAGNSVVVKPAPEGHRTAVRLAELFHGAGWPKGLFNVLGGDRGTAAALVQHPHIRAVSFTGSTAGGDALARLAGAKKFVAELGSNAANIVFADADLKTAATKIAAAGFEASGQQCISAQRVLVEHSVYDAFGSALVAAAKVLNTGAPADPSTDIGPMIDEDAAKRATAMFDDACSRGGKALLTPQRDRALLSPGIVADLSFEARLWREEVFGPIVVMLPFDSIDHALALANDSAFGLQGAVFTQNLSTMLRFVNEFEVGSMWVNEASRFRLDMYPFGGVKSSGVGREGLRYAIEEMSQLKFIGIRA